MGSLRKMFLLTDKGHLEILRGTKQCPNSSTGNVGTTPDLEPAQFLQEHFTGLMSTFVLAWIKHFHSCFQRICILNVPQKWKKILRKCAKYACLIRNRQQFSRILGWILNLVLVYSKESNARKSFSTMRWSLSLGKANQIKMNKFHNFP